MKIIITLFSLFTLVLTADYFENTFADDSLVCVGGDVTLVRINNSKPICVDESTADRWVQLGIAEILVKLSPSEGNLKVSSAEMIKQLAESTEIVFGKMTYDLVPNVEVKIVDLKIIPMYDKPRDPFDDSDVLVIKFEITNKGIDYFVLSDKMFKILVLDPSFPVGKGKPESSYIVDNYFTLYDDELEVKYDDYPNLKVFGDCDYLHDRIFVNQTKTYSICFDVLRKWNNEVLNIDSSKHYFLVLMDHTHSNSCPNCIENLLSSEMMSSDYKKILLPSNLKEMLDENDIANLPSWIQKTIEWYNLGMISETELINAINYLNTKSSDKTITQVGKQIEKTKLRLNDIPTSIFNGGMTIVFSGNLSTGSEFIPNAEILIVGDGPCPANGIISKGLTSKFGRYHIFTETMIWDPFDNMIKIHAEYLGNEIYLPSSSQIELIVVYPTKDTKSC